MDGRFTDEELAIAKSVDLCAVAESLGYTVKRIGKYHTLKEMDSIRIYNRSDIVNIGLHFFHKDVRPYAASCSEA